MEQSLEVRGFARMRLYGEMLTWDLASREMMIRLLDYHSSARLSFSTHVGMVDRPMKLATRSSVDESVAYDERVATEVKG
jgi:hypothetical protein